MRSWLNKGDKNRFSSSTKMDHFTMGTHEAVSAWFSIQPYKFMKENFLPLDNQCHEVFNIQTGLTEFY
jgi:hypothetical protein